MVENGERGESLDHDHRQCALEVRGGAERRGYKNLQCIYAFNLSSNLRFGRKPNFFKLAIMYVR
jgi:hypothetical protein